MIGNGQNLGITSKEQPVASQIGSSVGTLLAVAIVAFAAAAPFAWLLMLFLGNVGVRVGFWGALPGGALIGMLVAARARS